MKYDLTQYSEIARKAMAYNRKQDENYTWTLKAINKNSIKFRWSYLEGKDEEFVLTVRESDGEPYILVEIPYCSNICILVGDEFYCDVKTLEAGIYKAIKATAHKAMHLF